MAAAQAQGIALATLAPGDVVGLEALHLPADPTARMGEALRAGKLVVVPLRPVLVGGQPRVALVRS
jgi:hypothetical protein